MRHGKTILALFLLFALVWSMSGCGLVQAANSSREAVKEELDAFLAGDENAAYAKFYPGTISREEFSELFAKQREYCPITEGYELKTVSFNKSTNITPGMSREFHNGEFLLSFGGQSFHIITSYVTDKNGAGFQTWRIFNEEDYKLFRGVG